MNVDERYVQLTSTFSSCIKINSNIMNARRIHVRVAVVCVCVTNLLASKVYADFMLISKGFQLTFSEKVFFKK